jgi:DNA repair protein RecO (recombination protein O)
MIMEKSSINLQKAFVLHTRAYHETSVLVDLLTQKSGRICLIAKGVRSLKSSLKEILQPFIPLVINWYGRGELPTLRTAEIYGKPGFYLNELLMRVLPRMDPCEEIFNIYFKTIEDLSSEKSEQIPLRRFEKFLLKALGYELQLTHEATSNKEIIPDKHYIFPVNYGFSSIEPKTSSSCERKFIFSGKNLLAIARDDYSDPSTLYDAKRLMRLALEPLLGNKPLKSRELFKHTNFILESE